MAAERKVIDIDHNPELIHVVDEIDGPKVLRRNGEEMAVARSLQQRRRRRQKVGTQADVEAFLAAARGWKGLVDADQLIADIYADRDLEIRESDEQ
jgi:hypothetical protein